MMSGIHDLLKQLQIQIQYEKLQGDHSSEKPANVEEFNSRQGIDENSEKY